MAAKKVATRARKEGLRKPQVAILETLSKNSKPLTRAQISEKSGVDLAMMNSYIGAHDDATRHANDKKNFKSLRTLGFVKVEEIDVDGRDTIVHSITASGRSGLKKAQEEAKAKAK